MKKDIARITINKKMTIRETMSVINNATRCGFPPGIALLIENKKLIGVVTDGDIRRALDSAENIKSIKAKNIMTPNPKTTKPNALMTEAEELMHLNKISSLIVTDDNEKLLGILQLHNIDIIYK